MCFVSDMHARERLELWMRWSNTAHFPYDEIEKPADRG